MTEVYNTYSLATTLDQGAWEELIIAPPTDAIYYCPGGMDIDPALYGEEVTYTHLCQPWVDLREFDLVQRLLALHIPLLGICRGHQIITVAAGGTLYQDVNIQLGIWHGNHRRVALAAESRLAEILGTENPPANSLHHQATKDVPPGWRIAAWSDDGVIEAIEHYELPVVSVQWHPEMMRTDHQFARILNYLDAEQEERFE